MKRRGRKPLGKDWKPFSCKLHAGTIAALRAVAKVNNKTVSEVANTAINHSMKDYTFNIKENKN